MFRFSNKNKLVINFVVLLFLGLLASTFVAYKHVKEWQEQAIYNDLQLKASLVASRLNSWVQQNINQVEHFALFIATSNKPLREHQLYQRYVEQHPNLSDLEYLGYALESDGYYGIFDWKVPDGYDPRQRPWYIEGKAADSSIISMPYISVNSRSEIYLAVTSPITVNNQFMGIASAHISIENARASFGAIKMDIEDEVFLIDKQGNIIAHNDPNKTGSVWAQYNNSNGNNTVGNGSLEFIESSDTLFFTLKQNEKFGWQLVLSVPKEKIDQQLLSGTLTILAKFLLIFIAVVFGMYLTNRHLVSPLFDYMELDSVTLLPDKKHFKKQIVDQYLLPGKSGYLLIINMEDFSRHTATYAAGQIHLLQNEIKERLLAQLPDKAVLGSFSESRYIIYCERDSEAAQDYCEKIMNSLSVSLSSQYKIAHREINCSFRIGASCYPNHGNDIEELIDSAFSALANVGKNKDYNHSYGWFSPETNQKFSDELLINSAIKNAISTDEFTMAYQPQINSRTGEMIALEALIRWSSKELKRIIAPSEFIPIAERSELIVSLGDYVIESVLKQINEWNQQKIDFGYVSINISPKQLLTDNFRLKLLQSIKKHNVLAKHVELEITETSVMANPEATIKLLRQLKTDGFAIAMDDFGTGYSSLQYINMLNIDKLKIDRSLIVDLDKNEKTAILANTVVSMAKNLKIDVLAEGVERKEEAAALDSFGCYFIQGYLYSKPLAPSAVIPFVENNRASTNLIYS